MNKFFVLTAFLLTGVLRSQENTEVFVFDIAPSYTGIELLNVRNVSNNEGYDNQPSFISNEALVFAGNNNGQIDISEYDFNTKLKRWVNAETEGGEYSPQKFPSSTDVAAVRLDKDGKQRLYRYSAKTGESSVILEDLQVAYFAFYNDQKILATVLNNEKLDLVMIDLQLKSVDTLFSDAGRSIQKVPKSKSISYTLINESKKLDLYVLDINSGESYFICELPTGVQDYVWLNDTQVLVGMNSTLYLYDTLGEAEWNKVASVSEFGIKNISRMAISPNGKKLALVGEQL
jgi:Tol biopolymer transport system component